MLPDHHRLARRSDITSALRRGRRRGSPLLVVHVAPSPRPGPTRAAFAVSSAVGNSVIRHRITRRLRAAVLPLLDQLPEGTDLVIRALPPAKDATYTELDDELQRLLNLRPRDRQTAVPTPVPEHPVPEHPVPEHPVPEHPVQEQPGSARTGLGRVLYVIGSPLRWLLIGLVMIYRKVISPVLPPTCRYHPSCSAYALESLQVHGAAKGFVLAVWRVLRCNPFTRGGLDPVPERGAWHPPIYPDGSPRDPGAVGLPGDRGNISPVPTTDPAP